jgi:2',3'-cyclic-nucleotide 2'-phosphodiesterase (5'-nucleotidase family)
LEARFKIIRTQESNYGNFFADLFRLYYDTDIAVLNSGTIRNDIILPEGQIKFSKLTNIIEDIVIVKVVPG